MRRLSHTQAKSLLDLYRASGLTQSAFRKKHNIGTSLFAYWLPRCEAEPKPEANFQEIIFPQLNESQKPCIITFPNGVKLEFPIACIASVVESLSTQRGAC